MYDKYPLMFRPQRDINMPQEEHRPAEMILQSWQNYLEGLWYLWHVQEEQLSKLA